ncbi:CaiB/BaiF CoA-transferase family protein [Immundisolibacter sp.]|uniref:CaiB/BaiF CoA transferase family protein n=1 Tax=Immundisolibacter sp. TaxID=1934948 RepID=UPI00260E5AFD|nr:CaiB/BaiF CoA-transferase family protein [Immundisolibacter sp.]MDD3652334.1 CaiB/BaiF CoA-transferase family protein [Immundisolibacter sp.]
MAGPLAGIRVLDLSRVLAGPWCSQLLADMGAEVIKIERPGRGDDTRGWGPPYLKDRTGQDTPDAAYFLAANRGKRSVTVDFTRPEGQALIRELAALSDVLIENLKVGDLARYGLDYAALAAINPRLVYCSITGFGQTGPLASRPGYDFIIQAMGGLMSVTGERDDRPGGGPQKLGIAYADLTTGMHAAIAVLAALVARGASGRGQYVDLALLDVQVASMAVMAMNYFIGGKVPGRYGNAHPNIVPYEVFQAADGPFVLAVGNDRQFARLCEVLGVPELAADPSFTRNAGRVQHREELTARLQAIFATRPAQAWEDALCAVDVPCGRINDVSQVFELPQVRSRGMKITLEHPDAGPIPLVGSPLRFSDTPVEYRLPPPRLGEHTHAVLRELLGKDETEIAALRAAGVV